MNDLYAQRLAHVRTHMAKWGADIMVLNFGEKIASGIALLVRWRKLHAVRTILSLIATKIYSWLIVWA